MILDKFISSRIAEFDKPFYKECFYKILKNLSEDKLDNAKDMKVHRICQSFQEEERKSNFNWNFLRKKIEEENEEYSVPILVFDYLLIKAKLKLDEIKKFSQEFEMDYKEILSIVK
jgi:hypothetical protein